MKGTTEFTQDQERRMRELLPLKRNAPKDEQKRVRDRLREMGFYISDFGKFPGGFDVPHLNALIRSGRIKIV